MIRSPDKPGVGAARRRRVRTPRWAGRAAQCFDQRIGGACVRWVQAGTGPPLLLLHGYAGSAHWWVRNIAALARTHTVFALDLPGFGASRMPGRYTFARTVELLAAWMEANSIGCADVVGHSMGGQIAMLLAAAHTGRVRRLVLIAPAGIPFTTDLLRTAGRAFGSRMASDPRFTPIVMGGAISTSPRILWQAVRQIRDIDVRSLVRSLTVPTLILWGTRDRLLPVENAATLSAAIARAQVTIVPDASHILFFEQAGRVNEAILSFLAQP